jgi:hypothetical protein
MIKVFCFFSSEKKAFFFEKKKQKTFVCWGVGAAWHGGVL